jgi:hypothetical protein
MDTKDYITLGISTLALLISALSFLRTRKGSKEGVEIAFAQRRQEAMNIISANLIALEEMKRRLEGMNAQSADRIDITISKFRLLHEQVTRTSSSGKTHRQLIEFIESMLTGMSDTALELTGLLNLISAREIEYAREKDATTVT